MPKIDYWWGWSFVDPKITYEYQCIKCKQEEEIETTAWDPSCYIVCEECYEKLEVET